MSDGQASFPIAGGFNWLALCYALCETFMVVRVCIGLLVLFRQRLNHQGGLAKSMAADVSNYLWALPTPHVHHPNSNQLLQERAL
jgi:hypothetical protein